MHLRAHRRMQAVGRDQQRACHFLPPAVACLDQGRDAVGVLPITGHALAQAHGIVAQSRAHGIEQQHLQLSAMHRVLRPAVAGGQTARLGIDLVAVATHQRPFARLQADGVEHVVAEAQVVQLAYGVGLQVDADAQRLQLGHGLEDDARHADLMEGERGGHATDAAASDEDGAGRVVRGGVVSGHGGRLSMACAGPLAGYSDPVSLIPCAPLVSLHGPCLEPLKGPRTRRHPPCGPLPTGSFPPRLPA